MTLADLDIGDWLCFLTTILATVYVVLYGTRSRWTQNRVGRTHFFQSSTIAVFLIQISITLLTESSYVGRDIVRPIAYGAGAVGYFALIIMLLIMQQRDRRGGELEEENRG